GYVLGLHRHLAVGVEQRGGGVVALLDVGRVRRADERRAHLLARRAKRPADDLQLDGVKPTHARAPAAGELPRPARACSRCRWIVPHASPSPAQPGATNRVAPDSRCTVGPSIRSRALVVARMRRAGAVPQTEARTVTSSTSAESSR